MDAAPDDRSGWPWGPLLSAIPLLLLLLLLLAIVVVAVVVLLIPPVLPLPMLLIGLLLCVSDGDRGVGVRGGEVDSRIA